MVGSGPTRDVIVVVSGIVTTLVAVLLAVAVLVTVAVGMDKQLRAMISYTRAASSDEILLSPASTRDQRGGQRAESSRLRLALVKLHVALVAAGLVTIVLSDAARQVSLLL